MRETCRQLDADYNVQIRVIYFFIQEYKNRMILKIGSKFTSLINIDKIGRAKLISDKIIRAQVIAI